MLAESYKMPESEFAARFTDNEIARIKLYYSAKAHENELRFPKQ